MTGIQFVLLSPSGREVTSVYRLGTLRFYQDNENYRFFPDSSRGSAWLPLIGETRPEPGGRSPAGSQHR